MEGFCLYALPMRPFLSVAALLLVACSNDGAGPTSSPSQNTAAHQIQANQIQEDEEQIQDLPENKGPADPLNLGSRPVHRAGYEMASDTAVFARVQTPVKPAPGLDAPETGTGEYANPGWKLPSSEDDPAPTETRPQPQEELVPPPVKDDQNIIPHERVIEEIPSTRIVEDLP